MCLYKHVHFHVLQLVPIIYFASVRALSLSKLEVSITLLTDGGQSVEYYEVSGSDVNCTVAVQTVAVGYIHWLCGLMINQYLAVNRFQEAHEA